MLLIKCTAQHYAGMEAEAVMEKMKENTDGLTIITQGAGDTFKAGCVYGLLHEM